MKTVWKYPLNYAGSPIRISMPVHAEVVHAGLDPVHQPCLWAIVKDNAPKTSRIFYVAGTGHEVPNNTVYIKSWVDGPFVWHLFEFIS